MPHRDGMCRLGVPTAGTGRIAKAVRLAGLGAPLAALGILAATAALAAASAGARAEGRGEARRPVSIECSGVRDVRVTRSGVSSESRDGRTFHVDMLSLALGPVDRSEAQASFFVALYGPSGLDAYVWTPDPGEGPRWLRVEYTRPATFIAVERLEKEASLAPAAVVGDARILPAMLHHLDPSEVATIGHIACFKEGGVRIELRRGVTWEEAEALADRIRATLR